VVVAPPAAEEELAVEVVAGAALDSVVLLVLELLEPPQPAASSPAASSAAAAVPRITGNLFIANLQLVAWCEPRPSILRTGIERCSGKTPAGIAIFRAAPPVGLPEMGSHTHSTPEARA
jgi:hypothetical protein